MHMPIPFFKLFKGVLNAGEHIKNKSVLKAIESDDINYIKEWLENGGDPDERCSSDLSGGLIGDRPPILYHALENEVFHIAKLLIDYGANVNLNEEPDTLLAVALKHGSVEMADYLIENHADINATGETGFGLYGKTALMSICESDCGIKFVKYLVEKGANVYIQDQLKETALFYALQSDAEVFEYLLDRYDRNKLNLHPKNRTSLLYRLCDHFYIDSIDISENKIREYPYDDLVNSFKRALSFFEILLREQIKMPDKKFHSENLEEHIDKLESLENGEDLLKIAKKAKKLMEKQVIWI